MKLALLIYLLAGVAGTIQDSPSITGAIAPRTDVCTQKENLTITEENLTQVLGRWASDLQKQRCFVPTNILEFIDTVVDYEAETYFNVAEGFYFRLLTNGFKAQNFTLLEKEVSKVLPLVPGETSEKWKDKLEAQDLSLADDLIRFWNLRDPVLSTTINERLREHWQRIAHARQNYTKNRNTVYGTDDRGLIYVQLGPPTHNHNGILRPSSTDIRSRLYDIQFHKGGLSTREIQNLHLTIRQYYMPLRYEVWVYNDLKTSQRVLYMFGKSASQGTFGLRRSVEEFIDPGTFNKGITPSGRYNSGPRGLTIGPFLQTALYRNLASIDIYFANMLSFYDGNWLNYITGNDNFAGMEMQNSPITAKMELRKIQNRAPANFSSLEQNIDNIDQAYRTYRFLDNDLQPVQKVLIFARPKKNILKYDRLMHPNKEKEYRIFNIIKLSGGTLPGPIYYHDVSPLHASNEPYGYLVELPDSVIPRTSPAVQVGTELHRNISVDKSTGTKRATVIASVVSPFNRPVSLEQPAGGLQVSDLIWGYNPAVVNHNLSEINFHIPSDKNIPKGKNFSVYFESYLTESSPETIYTYQLEYEIKRVQRRRLVDRGIKLNLTYESGTARTGETLEIDTSRLEAGQYRAFFRFGTQSLPADQWIERTIDFRVEE